MTDEELIARLREIQGQAGLFASEAADRIEALRAERDEALTFLDNAVSKAPEPLKALGKYLAGRLDEDEWPTAEQYLNAAAKACADRAEAAEAQIAALTARVEGLTEAARGYRKAISDFDGTGDMGPKIARFEMWQAKLDATLTTEADNG